MYVSIEKFHSLTLCGRLNAFLALLSSSNDRIPKFAIAIFPFRAATIYHVTVSRVSKTPKLATYNMLECATVFFCCLPQNSAIFIYKSGEIACIVLRSLEQFLNYVVNLFPLALLVGMCLLVLYWRSVVPVSNIQ